MICYMGSYGRIVSALAVRDVSIDLTPIAALPDNRKQQYSVISHNSVHFLKC